MVELENLARGLQRFRRTPERIHAAYLEPMRQTLYELGEAKRRVGQSANLANSLFLLHVQLQLQNRYRIDAGSLQQWLTELRAVGVFSWDSESLGRLEQLSNIALMCLYQQPQTYDVRETYGSLAHQAESEVAAIAATIPSPEIKDVVPLLVYFAQLNIISEKETPNIMPATNGVPISEVDPEELKRILDEFLMADGYSVRSLKNSPNLLELGPELDQRIMKLPIFHTSPTVVFSNSYLIRAQGDVEGFVVAFNEHSPPPDEPGKGSNLRMCPYIRGNPARAIGLAQNLAAHLGYNIMKLDLFLENDVLQAATEAGLHFIKAYTTSVGVFLSKSGRVINHA